MKDMQALEEQISHEQYMLGEMEKKNVVLAYDWSIEKQIGFVKGMRHAQEIITSGKY